MTKLRLKRKTRLKFKNMILLSVCLICFSMGFSFVYNIKLYSSNEEFIGSLLADSNHYKKYSHNIISTITNIIYSSTVDKPITLLSSTFNFNGDISYDEEYDADELEAISKHISDPSPTEANSPIVYIYNSHQLENYSGSNYEAYNITPNVMMASYIMREKLKNQGIEAIAEESDITEFIRINNWNYNYSYLASRYYIEAAIKEYPSLKYFIDIHRDSITKANSTVTINNTNYATVLFVVGLEHKNYQSNLDLANYINTKIANKYPNLTRGVITKKGSNVNGIYNQDISPNAVLIEIGGYENTIDEVYNTVVVLSQLLKETINER